MITALGTKAEEAPAFGWLSVRSPTLPPATVEEAVGVLAIAVAGVTGVVGIVVADAGVAADADAGVAVVDAAAAADAVDGVAVPFVGETANLPDLFTRMSATGSVSSSMRITRLRLSRMPDRWSSAASFRCGRIELLPPPPPLAVLMWLLFALLQVMLLLP